MSRTFTLPRQAPAAIPTPGILRAGAAVRDITPALGAPLSGYGSIRGELSRTLWGRLFVTALVLDDGAGGRVALVGADLHAGARYLAELVANETAPTLGIGIDRLFFAGTHTHSGPGHIYGCTLYDRMAAREQGLDVATSAWLAQGIAAAVREAAESLRPARVGHGLAHCWGYSMNRSLRAFTCEGARPQRFAIALAHGEEVPTDLTPENQAVDSRVQVIWAETTEGEPIGAFATFAAHGTAIPAHLATLSADWLGCAVREAQDRIAHSDVYWARGVARRRVPIALVAGSIGDADVDLPHLGLAEIVSLQGTGLAASVGAAVGASLESACRRARASLDTALSIGVFFAEPEPAGACLEDSRSLAPLPAFGVPAIGGSELGRNFALDAEILASSLDLESRRGERDPDNPQAPKLTFEPAAVESLTGAPPPVLPLRLLTIEGLRGQLAVVGVPCEPTTMLAFRIERMLRDRGAVAVMLSGVTGDYHGYFTTPGEYDRQHYEGASTLWGRAAGDWLLERIRSLSRDLQPPLSPEATFAEEATFQAPGFTAAGGAALATTPLLTFDDGDLTGAWTAPEELLPTFGPSPWIAVQELNHGEFRPLQLGAAEVTDQSRAMFVERSIDGLTARWSCRWPVPHELRGRTLRFVLVCAAFGLTGAEAASNPVTLA